MKKTFLLDENILYHAIKGVDEHNHPDTTAAKLLQRIGQNCHRITMDVPLRNRYQSHLKKLLAIGGTYRSQALLFITQLLRNSAKSQIETDAPPELPEGVNIPAEDTHVVRAALISHPIIVTADTELRNAINNYPVLGSKR